MTETAVEPDETEVPSSYTSETPGSAAAPAAASTPRNIEANFAVGRRKEAVARVRLVPGSGQWRLNGRPLEEYFPNKVHQQAVREPFDILALGDTYDVIATIDGGGISGQAGALRLGIARALQKIEADDRPAMKRAGFLKRDPRVKERKKYGLKKARKAPQYSKR